MAEIPNNHQKRMPESWRGRVPSTTKGLEHELQGLEIAHHRCTPPVTWRCKRMGCSRFKKWCWKDLEKTTSRGNILENILQWHDFKIYYLHNVITLRTKSKHQKTYLKALHLLTWLFITWSDCLKNIYQFFMRVKCPWRSVLPPYLPQPGVQTGFLLLMLQKSQGQPPPVWM